MKPEKNKNAGPGVPNDPNDLYHLMRSCGHILYHNGSTKSSQGRILHILEKEGTIGQKDLQQILKIKSGSVSEVLTKLEKEGLIERSRDECDRRRVIITMTQKGRIHAHNYNESRDWFAVLDAQQKEQLKELLQLLLESWSGAQPQP